jgi:hypothetical protein
MHVEFVAPPLNRSGVLLQDPTVAIADHQAQPLANLNRKLRSMKTTGICCDHRATLSTIRQDRPGRVLWTEGSPLTNSKLVVLERSDLKRRSIGDRRQSIPGELNLLACRGKWQQTCTNKPNEATHTRNFITLLQIPAIALFAFSFQVFFNKNGQWYQ